METINSTQVRFTALEVTFQPYYPRWIVEVRITTEFGPQTEQTVEIHGNHTMTVTDVWEKAVNKLTNWNQ